ncbi:hypothetical protein [Chromohalobacter israelensis]|uniref:hypothetical protein n=1 Tax=Chromohalobacter israelensis TaxID=141390 RepID=UPI00265B958B|nr:hypothetical protein [Chromohalobacter salexigens]MDO0945940.1 hypothetical protein [Chromohalobacter salexigens]
MAKPSRALMLEILERAAETNPDPCEMDSLNSDWGVSEVTATISYLVEHKLVTAIGRKRVWGIHSYAEVTITAAGLDYISDDGGLTAELGVVTVRLEAETIRTMIAAHIEMAEGSRHEKTLLRKQLEALPEEGLRHLTKQLIDSGLRAAPQTIQWLQTLIGHG